MKNDKMQERIARLMPGGSPRWIRVYDNGGATVDRFTVLFTGRIAGKAPGWNFYLCMSSEPYYPQGFGQHGEYQGRPFDVNRHGFAPAIGRKCQLGRRIRFDMLPEPCRRLVVDDYAEYWRLDKQSAFRAAGEGGGMKMGKHTPGPWELEAGRSFSTQSGRFRLSYGTNARTGVPEFNSFVELDANARLIAAAPDMLEALEDLTAWTERIQPVIGLVTGIADALTLENFLCAARDAIAKAKGE